MKANVDEQACVGCGLCCETCPEVFELKDGVAIVKLTPVPKSQEKECKKATEDCPASAIRLEDQFDNKQTPCRCVIDATYRDTVFTSWTSGQDVACTSYT